MSDEFALDEFTFVFAGVGLDYMGTNFCSFDSFAGTGGVGFAPVAFSVVGADLFGAFDGEAIIVRAGIGNIGTNNGVIGANVDLADASFEASAFY